MADYLDGRAEKGSKLGSLCRHKASIAKVHQLLDLKDPTQTSQAKLLGQFYNGADGGN